MLGGCATGTLVSCDTAVAGLATGSSAHWLLGVHLDAQLAGKCGLAITPGHLQLFCR